MAGNILFSLSMFTLLFGMVTCAHKQQTLFQQSGNGFDPFFLLQHTHTARLFLHYTTPLVPSLSLFITVTAWHADMVSGDTSTSGDCHHVPGYTLYKPPHQATVSHDNKAYQVDFFLTAWVGELTN